MGFSINYTDIRELAMSGYSEPMRPGLILPFGLESKYFSDEDAKKYGTWFDVERAKQALKEAGYRPVWNEKGELIETRDAQGNKALHDGKLPGPKYIVHPIYKSNSAFSIALQQGRLDMSSTFVPRIWLKEPKGVRTWFDKPPYFLAAAMPMLFINVKHEPLGDVAYRRAMAFAVNYDDIRELAMSGYSEPLQPGLILPFGLESKYYNADDAKQYGVTYDVARAKATLAAAGYKSIFNEKGDLLETRNRAGQRVPTVHIKSPTGWSDWEAIVRIAVRGMRAAGIDARERFVDASIFWSDIYQGEFDLIMYTPVSPFAPSTV